jgi:SAM-dependent methyltransferase
MIQTVTFNNKKYPYFQSQGNAARFAIPFAREILSGVGLDIGCSKEEWAFPGAELIDSNITTDDFHATHLPDFQFDYIFSSHCLEHVDNWVRVLQYWKTRLRIGGVLFLYLPHYSQEYWRPWNNSKHVNVLSPRMVRDFLTSDGWDNIFVTKGYDLNNSFYAIANK